MIHFLRRLLAPIDRFLDGYCRDLASRGLAARGLADAAECPDEVEPPEDEPPEPEPIYHELITEIVLDLANERAAENGGVDLALWEYEYRTRTGTRDA